jgi:hypothetical protein
LKQFENNKMPGNVLNKYLTHETTLLPPMIGLVNLFGAH